MSEVETVEIKALIRDDRFQVRNKLNTGTVKEYAAKYSAGVEMPPIAVARVNGTGLVVLDGWHRLAALDKIMHHEVTAVIVEATEQDVYWLAAKANLTHGLALKASEHRAVFRSYIRSREHYEGKRLKSYREMARELGGARSYSTIRNWMKKDHPKIASRMGDEEAFSGIGGLQNAPLKGSFEGTSSAAMHGALAAFLAVDTPQGRGELIQQCEDMLSTMKRHAPWEPPDF